MKSPKPNGFNTDEPPKIHIPDLPVIDETPEENVFEIKNPILANLFHYGIITIILIVALFFGKILGGILGALGIASWATGSNYYDKKKGGF
ncbi:hypothetical protein V2O64_21965 [Verrucomicrobiaceae bacterium 227]